jgi:host factor-I protein
MNEERGPETQREAPPYVTHQEAKYLRQLIDRNVTVTIKMRDGQTVSGVLEYYDARFVRLTREKEGLPNLFIFKQDILYLAENPAGT